MITLGDIRRHVHKDVGGGQCEDSELVTFRVNQAVYALMKESFDKGEFQEWCVRCAGSCLLLPAEIETPEVILADGVPALPKPIWYKYLCDRKPCPDPCKCDCLEFEDLGDGFVTDVKPPHPMSLLVTSERPSNAEVEEVEDAIVTIHGIGADDKPLYSFNEEAGRTKRGVDLRLIDEDPEYSDMPDLGTHAKTMEITAISKPLTNFPVQVFFYEHKTEEQIQDGDLPTLIPALRLMPWETKICRRKIEIRGAHPEVVRILGRARYRDMIDPTDVSLIQDMELVRIKILQIEAEAMNETRAAVYHRQSAEDRHSKSFRHHIGRPDVSFRKESNQRLGSGVQNMGGGCDECL